MPRYYFNLKDGRGLVRDFEGTELPDEGSIRAHAIDVARQLMRNREDARRSWRLQVWDCEHRIVFELLFADADRSLDHLSSELKASLMEMYAKTGGLTDTITDMRTTLYQLKGTLARVDRAPWLAAIDGRRI